MMATRETNSTSSVTTSWEVVDEGVSCQCSASDQKSAVLDGSVDGQTPGPASPDDLLRSEVPRPKSDGDHSPNHTES